MFQRRQNDKAVKFQLLSLSKAIKDPIYETHQYKKILFCPLNGTTLNTVREALIAMACVSRGAEVCSIYLDSNLPTSEFYTSFWERIIYLVKVKENIKYSEKLGIKTYRTSDFKSEAPESYALDHDTISTLEYKGILIGDLVVAATVRVFKSNGPDWNDPLFCKNVEKAVKSAKMLIDLYSKALDKIKPDKLVMSHGIYITWGTLFRLARKRNIEVDVYGSSYRKNTLRFYHNMPNAPVPINLWPEFKDKALSDKENEILDRYIDGRETQKDDNITLFSEKTEVPEHIKTFIENQKGKKLFCMFTGVSWDAFANSTGDSFKDLLEWVEETISYFNKREDAALIVKTHPAEIYHKTPEKYRLRTFVNTLQLNSNILLIREDEEVKPFWLYEKIDFGLVYTSTVSVEMALKNMTVLTSGADGHLSNKGFTIDPKTKDEYFEKLDLLVNGELDYHPDITAAKRYLFYRFFREAIVFDVFELASQSAVNKLMISSPEELMKGKNRTLDVICEGILDNGKFITAYE